MPSGKYVFISYSTQDLAVVNEVLGSLLEWNVKYWKAPEHIPAGSSYAKEIVSALSNASLVLVFISRHSQSSQWVEKEIDSAVNYERKIIPLMIDDTPLNGVFRFYLNNVQMIFYKNDPAAAIEELKGELEKLNLIIDKKAMFLRKAGSKGSTVAAKKPVASANSKTSKPKKSAPKMVNNLSQQSTVLPKMTRQAPPPNRPRRMKPVDFTSLNRRPIVCDHCGGPIEEMGSGTYRCTRCGLDSFDDFAAIRRYIEQNGGGSVSELSAALGIPREIVNDWRNRQ